MDVPHRRTSSGGSITYWKMTEGHNATDDKPMCVRVWLEVGHVCEPLSKSSLGRSLTRDWKIWVRGLNGSDISLFVHKVVFHLNPPSAFVYPKRVIQEPPYEIQESSSKSIDIPIHVYVKNNNKPKKIKFRYSLQIDNLDKGCSESSQLFYDFENPSAALHQLLMEAGGKVIGRAGHNGITLLDSYPDERKKPVKHKMKTSRCRYAGSHKTCGRCSVPGEVDFSKPLKAVKMTDSEAAIVSELYKAQRVYEKSVNGLSLPPINDPIYQVPELPHSLQRLLTSVESNYTMP